MLPEVKLKMAIAISGWRRIVTTRSDGDDPSQRKSIRKSFGETLRKKINPSTSVYISRS